MPCFARTRRRLPTVVPAESGSYPAQTPENSGQGKIRSYVDGLALLCIERMRNKRHECKAVGVPISPNTRPRFAALLCHTL
jgi:hypothetical protein